MMELTEDQKAALLSDLDCDMAICFELLDLELADYETDTDDNMFWWLTDKGRDALNQLESAGTKSESENLSENSA